MTGIRNARYLADFLGKRIAVQDSTNPNKYYLYHLTAIYADHLVQVTDKQGQTYFMTWEECENPYVIIILPNVEIETR